jgi:hypothetical protein
MVSDEEVIVVDFKTGEPRSEEHLVQISTYGRLLEAIYPDRPVSRYLLYVDEGRVEKA